MIESKNVTFTIFRMSVAETVVF